MTEQSEHPATEQSEHPAVAADERHSAPAPTRRTVLLGAGALGAVGLLVACGEDTSTPSPTAGGGTTAPPANTGDPTGAPTGAPTTTAATGGGIKAADIPVGGGTIFKDQNFVITQPTAGIFMAFDATCQHMGCQVANVRAGKINCLCHGSQYNIADGSVARGPSQGPLPAKKVTVFGDTLTVA